MGVIRALLVALLLSVSLTAQGPSPPATASGSLASTASVPLNVSGYASVAFQVTGTWVGTITFEGSVDGATFQALNATPTNSSSAATTTTANGVWTGSVGGLKSARARMSAYTSGTAVVTIQAAASGGSSGGGGGGSGPSGTIGAAVPATASPAAVKDNAGNLAYPTLDVSGNLLVAVTGAGSGGTSSVDGSAYTAGTTAGTPLMGARDDAGTTACAEDKNCIARLTSSRALLVDLSATAANTNKLLVTPDLPTGASTAAKQPALGTAGTASADVITIQGIAAMTKLLVTPDSVALPANQSVNVAQLAGTTTDTNSGTKSAGTLRVVLATDQPALTNKLLVTPDSVALPANQSVNVAQINGVTVTMGNGAAGTGVQRVAIASDNTAFESIPVATASTTNGTSTCYITSAASTNSTNCKGSAGNVYEYHVTNTTTTNYFLRIYNASAAPTCSSATGFVETIPALGAAANGGINGRLNGVPQAFSTGIGFCLTGGGSSTDNTNAATGVYVTILYK